MSKLIVSEFVSLNGVIEAPGGEEGHPHTNWVLDYHDSELVQYKLDEVLGADSLLIGRVTYESFAGAWPSREGEMADKLNDMPKYIVSSTLEDPEWSNSTVLEGDVRGAVSKLRQESDGEILVHGSARLVHSLIENDLVDEYRLMVFPVVIADGKRMFPDSPRKHRLKLVDTRRFGSGVIVHTYQRHAP